MSKYGTIPASASSALTPEAEGSSDVPGSCAAFRPWRELADPRALSLPGGFADAYHRARANLVHFADNYKLVFLVILTVSLILSPSSFGPYIVLPCFFTMRGKAFLVQLALTFILLVLVGASASLLVALPVGLLPVLVHAMLRLPTEISVDEEAGRCSAAELPSTNC